jgi:hypothetical protein
MTAGSQRTPQSFRADADRIITHHIAPIFHDNPIGWLGHFTHHRPRAPLISPGATATTAARQDLKRFQLRIPRTSSAQERAVHAFECSSTPRGGRHGPRRANAIAGKNTAARRGARDDIQHARSSSVAERADGAVRIVAQPSIVNCTMPTKNAAPIR